jgi:hypothetical protein
LLGVVGQVLVAPFLAARVERSRQELVPVDDVGVEVSRSTTAATRRGAVKVDALKVCSSHSSAERAILC